MTTSTSSASATGLPDRRHFLSSLGAVGALGLSALPALATATSHPDAELLALREPFDQTWRTYTAALNVHSAAEAAAWTLKKTPAAERVEIDRRHAEADALVDRTGDANREIVDEMCRQPASTIEGLAFKAKVSLEHEDNRYEELVTSIMDDILAMGGSNA